MKNINNFHYYTTRHDVSCGALEFSSYGVILDSGLKRKQRHFVPLGAYDMTAQGKIKPTLRKLAHRLGGFLLAL